MPVRLRACARGGGARAVIPSTSRRQKHWNLFAAAMAKDSQVGDFPRLPFLDGVLEIENVARPLAIHGDDGFMRLDSLAERNHPEHHRRAYRRACNHAEEKQTGTQASRTAPLQTCRARPTAGEYPHDPQSINPSPPPGPHRLRLDRNAQRGALVRIHRVGSVIAGFGLYIVASRSKGWPRSACVGTRCCGAGTERDPDDQKTSDGGLAQPPAISADDSSAKKRPAGIARH